MNLLRADHANTKGRYHMDFKDMYKENMSVEEFSEIVGKLTQSEGDKIRTEYTKKLKELESKLPQEMTDEEKALHERMTALEQKEKALTLREKLTEKGLPSELLGLVQDESHIDILSQVLTQSKLNSSYVPSGHNQSNTGITKEQFKRMNYLEREKLQEQQPELYQALTCRI